MASVAPAADTTDLLQKLSLEPKSKTREASEITKKNTGSPSHDQSMTPALQNIDSNMCYYPQGYTTGPYFFGGYESMNDWEDYSRYVNPDGVEMPSAGVYGDMYHHGFGYGLYGAYPSPGSPAPMVGHDGQLYQYSTPYYQSPANAPYTLNQPPTLKSGVISTSASPDQSPMSLDATKINGNGVANATANGNSGSVPQKTNQQVSSVTLNGSYGRGGLANGLPSTGYQDPRFSFDGSRSPVPWFDGPMYLDGQHRMASNNGVTSTHVHNPTPGRNQNLRPLSHVMGSRNSRPTSGMGPSSMGPVTPGMMNRMYNAFSTGLGFRSQFYDTRTNGHWGVMDSRYKPRVRGNGFYGYGNESLDYLGELNRGPRANRFKNMKGFGSPVTVPVKGENLPTNGNAEDSNLVPDKDQYNKADFPVEYSDAKFFIIKSYSEDDIHKSVKYNVWASTPNGNRKLDAAYQEAQVKMDGCPIFLFFSVNTSGQFVGVAEMVGPVDFNKTVDYWQQDKWTGCFSVKWHIVKDVPNSILKHITLENNDYKPVTNSRDTQEVKLEQGLQVLKLFKEHVSKTSILDDFGFYDTRQKVMREKRAKQQQLHNQVVLDRKPVNVDEKDKDGENGPRLQKPLEGVTVTILKKETSVFGHGERKPSEGNGLTSVAAGDVLKVAKPSAEKRVVANGVAVVSNGVANGVANGC